jgi:hypothetical protein
VTADEIAFVAILVIEQARGLRLVGDTRQSAGGRLASPAAASMLEGQEPLSACATAPAAAQPNFAEQLGTTKIHASTASTMKNSNLRTVPTGPQKATEPVVCDGWITR